MSGVLEAPSRSIIRSKRVSKARTTRNAIAHVLIVASVVVALVPLVAIVAFVVAKGAKVISWEFLTSDIPITDRTIGGGMGPAVVGTLLITGAATLVAVPLGVLGGIYLNEYGARSRLGAECGVKNWEWPVSPGRTRKR